MLKEAGVPPQLYNIGLLRTIRDILTDPDVENDRERLAKAVVALLVPILEAEIADLEAGM